MTATLHMVEATPAAYPTPPSGLSTAAAALAPAALWARLEAWVTTRWTERTVVVTVEGPGEWTPPLTPWTLTSVEAWRDDDWHVETPRPGPLGGVMLPGSGPYRIMGTAGDDETPPAVVLEAYRRLAEYLADGFDAPAGATSYGVNVGGAMSENFRRSAAWQARALELSGAADLLRPYRRIA